MFPIWAEQIGTSRVRLEELMIQGYANPLKQEFVGDIGNVLWLLLGTVGIVLLIACANVANLFLVRSEGRQQEVAVRAALGAARGQIARQFVLESLVLGLLGGLAGLGLAFGGVRLLTWMGPAFLPRLNEISLDPTVLMFTLGISLLSGLLFGTCIYIDTYSRSSHQAGRQALHWPDRFGLQFSPHFYNKIVRVVFRLPATSYLTIFRVWHPLSRRFSTLANQPFYQIV